MKLIDFKIVYGCKWIFEGEKKTEILFVCFWKELNSKDQVGWVPYEDQVLFSHFICMDTFLTPPLSSSNLYKRLKTAEKKLECRRFPRPITTPACMRECSVSVCVKNWKLGCGGAATKYLGIENGVVPNVSGAGCYNVLSWSLFSESRQELAYY